MLLAFFLILILVTQEADKHSFPRFEVSSLSIPLTRHFEQSEVWNERVVVYENSSLYIYDLNKSVSYRLGNISRAFLTNFAIFFVHNRTCYNVFPKMKVEKVECPSDALFVFFTDQGKILFNGTSVKFGSKKYWVPLWRDEEVHLFRLSGGYALILYTPGGWSITLMFFDQNGSLRWEKRFTGDLTHYQLYNGDLFINIGSRYLSLPSDYGIYKISPDGVERITNNYKCYSKFGFTIHNASIYVANHYEVTACSLRGEITASFVGIKWFVSGNTLSDFGWHGLMTGRYLLVTSKDSVFWENIYLCRYRDKCVKLCRARNAEPLDLRIIQNKIVMLYKCGNKKLLKIQEEFK